MRMQWTLSIILGLIVLAPLAAVGQESVPSAKSLAFFEANIRPILAEHCYACHSGRSKMLRGGLRLDRAEHLQRGGETGPVVVAGKPDESSLIAAVRYESRQMPPQSRLPPRDIDLLVQWVRIGAPFPDSPSETRGKDNASIDRRFDFQITAEDRGYWAYQPLRAPQIPNVRTASWVHNPIDAFVLSRLEQEGLPPSPRATPRELVRRLAFDLTGLPPDAAAIESFAALPSEAAWTNLIEQLLSRPSYGERWGRHWLDVVRYAQTNGYERDAEKPFAWRYRDYVIRSFNRDKPFDRFIVEQLAGDQLANADHDSVIATAFYRLGVWDDEPDDAKVAEFDALDDILSTIGQAFLGQTVGCARCHNHMFDPISQREYYQLLAFVANIKPYEIPRFHLDSAVVAPLAKPELLTAWRGEQAAQLAALERRRDQLGKDDQAALAEIETQRKSILDSAPDVEWTLAVRDKGDPAQPTHLLIRGDPRTPGPRVSLGFPEIFRLTPPGARSGELPPLPAVVAGEQRLSLARWIASADHPLTARVMANRIWQHHFGRGIVSTPNDFGRAGVQPTHPELLDWLAFELIRSGWSVKHLHRVILQSNTWRMASRASNGLASRIDPDNQLFWRQNVRRLDAEAIRDSLLAVSGQLNREIGGRGFFPQLAGEVVAGQSKPGFGWELSTAGQRRRRSVYSFLKRGLRDPLLQAFDYGNTDSPLGVRPTTTVAPQALMLLNSRFLFEQARMLAQDVAVDTTLESAAVVTRLYRRVLGREPTDRERTIAVSYLAEQVGQFERLAGVITFRPEVPVSLYSEYRSQLAPDQYLSGPRIGWSYYAGKWSAGYEAIESVVKEQGPFALFTDIHFAGGTVQGKLRVANSTERATLLIRSRSVGSVFEGVSFALDPRHGELIATIRNGSKVKRFATAWQPSVDRWLSFRMTCTATNAHFAVEGAAPLVVDVPEEMVGHFGVATWGGSIDLSDLRIEPLASDATLPHGWRCDADQWEITADGTWRTRSMAGATIVRAHQPIENGEVSVDLRIAPGKRSTASLLLHANSVQAESDNWRGYEIRLDAENQTLLLGDHRDHWTERETRPFHVEPGRWYRLHTAIHGSLINVWVDDNDATGLQYVDPNPLPAGYIGLRTGDSEVAFRNLEIRARSQVTRVDFRPPRTAVIREERPARRRALEALCLVLLNLNEFVFVD